MSSITTLKTCGITVVWSVAHGYTALSGSIRWGVKDGALYYHERGVDNGETNPPSAIQSYVTSSDIDIEDGNRFAFIWRVIPDINFDGSDTPNPEAKISLLPRRNPGSAYGRTEEGNVTSADDFTTVRSHLVQKFTQYVYARVRGRQVAVRIQSDAVGTSWRSGIMRLDTRLDGRQ